MLARKDEKYLPCPSDSIVLFQTDVLVGLDDGQLRGEYDEQEAYKMAILEIKSRVAASSLSLAITLSKSNLVKCCAGDEFFYKRIPTEQMAQILLQLYVVGIHYSLYASAGETVFLCCVLIRCILELRRRCLDVSKAIAGPVVAWAHQERTTIQQFATADQIQPRVSNFLF